MGRSKKYEGEVRQLTDEADARRHAETLTRIEHLCEDFDKGRYSYSLPLAVEISKFLTEGKAATRERGKVQFPSPDRQDKPTYLSAFYPLTTVCLEGRTGRFEAAVVASCPEGWRMMKFKDWWGETVYRASAAKPGTPPGLLPVNREDQVPFAKRERLNRRQLVKLMRDKAGAHNSGEYPAVLEDIDGPDSWGGFAVQNGETGETLTTDDGSLEWTVGQLAASIREIAGEILVAYGRASLPPDRS